MTRRNQFSRGAGLVEIVIAISIITLVLTSVISTYPVFLQSALATVDQVRGALLLEEGVEAVKTLRDDSWTTNISSLTASTTYYLSFSEGDSMWEATSSPSTIDTKFTRTFAVYAVNRDNDDDIDTSGGGTVDANTRKLTVWVSWPDEGVTTTRSISTYITNIFDN